MLSRRHLPALRMLIEAFLLGTFLLMHAGCTKAPPPKAVVAPAEHIISPVGTTQTILQKTFSLRASATFPFEIPAHAVEPHLHGIFASFVGQLHGMSDDSANIDFLIMNEQQQSDFASNRPSEALFNVEASHDQAINFDLPASMSHPVKYYLVFRNPEGTSSKVVEANFRVDF